MFKVFLRAFISIVLFVVLLPVKFIAVLAYTIFMIYARIKYKIPIKETWETFDEALEEKITEDWHWIKTGE